MTHNILIIIHFHSLTGLYCYPVVCSFGIVGNLLSLIVFAQKNLRTSTNIYLGALATSDLLKVQAVSDIDDLGTYEMGDS